MSEPQRSRATPTGGGGDAVYALGLIGAVIWFWKAADGVGEHVLAVLKALVWPAFFVYEAFRALYG